MQLGSDWEIQEEGGAGRGIYREAREKNISLDNQVAWRERKAPVLIKNSKNIQDRETL